MPLHNWNHVEAGIFHALHTAWIGEIQGALNHGLLPAEYYALAEQHAGGYLADVLALRLPTDDLGSDTDEPIPSSIPSGGATSLLKLPQTSVRDTIDVDLVELRRTVAIRHVSNHKIVALIEIVSPTNKYRQQGINDFVNKTLCSLSCGIHVLVVDILQRGKFDSGGLHQVIRTAASANNEPNGSCQPEPSGIFISYQARRNQTEAFVEYPQLGQPLPAMPVFLNLSQYVYVPLEETYNRAWDGMPAYWRNFVAESS